MLFKPHRIPKAVLVGDVQADAMPPHKRKIIPCCRSAQKVLQHCLGSQKPTGPKKHSEPLKSSPWPQNPKPEASEP